MDIEAKHMKLLSIILTLFLLLTAVPLVNAEEVAEPTPIYSVEELLAIGDDPQGSYILMNDLDLAQIEWPCIDFSGSFDGNGHALLNLRLSQPSAETAITYDGNLKTYDTYFAGFFGILRNAEVKNLQLINVRGFVDTDTPFFLGGLAGFSEDSTITDCTVTGCLELRAYDRMFGVGGLIGYGSGTVQQCKVDVTLICTDTDANTRDEQFMGGIFSTGYMDVSDCEIIIDGYSSEYGYAHNGGITGMYMRNPIGKDYIGNLVDNTITGKITFFECNTNRRAYCAAEAGERLGGYNRISNTCDFIRDERREYDVELRPEMCQESDYTETVIPSGCSTYGYTEYTCNTCGYTYRDHYTLFTHAVTQWSVVEEATTQKEGLSEGSCDHCGMVFTRTEPVLEEQPTEPTTVATTQPTVPPTTVPVLPPEEPEEVPLWGILALIGGAVAVIVCIVLLPKKRHGGKYLKR